MRRQFYRVRSPWHDRGIIGRFQQLLGTIPVVGEHGDTDGERPRLPVVARHVVRLAV